MAATGFLINQSIEKADAARATPRPPIEPRWSEFVQRAVEDGREALRLRRAGNTTRAIAQAVEWPEGFVAGLCAMARLDELGELAGRVGPASEVEDVMLLALRLERRLEARRRGGARDVLA